MVILTRRTLASTFARSFLIQGSWNYHTMIGSGFAFAMLPVLRRVFEGDPSGLDASVQRHLEHFNAHPYLSGMALGAAVRLEIDSEDGEDVRRFKRAVRGPLGGLGDALVWASWLPAVSMLALAMVWLGAPAWAAVFTFLLVYNAGHLGLRVWAFRAGLSEGRGVGRSLSRAGLGLWTQRLRGVDALLLGVLAGAVLAGDGGLAESGVLWALMAAVAFLGGVLLGHRLWRPTAAIIVIVISILTTWGLIT